MKHLKAGRYEMAYQKVFKRYELKFILTKSQQAKILKAMEPYMEPDHFGRSTVRNIYFDTDDYILARHSIARPDFKEKLRIRSYSQADPESTVFVELKRKYDHVVYKRRVPMAETDAMNWTRGLTRAETGSSNTDAGSQMHSEIDYFLSYYKNLQPAVFLTYDRQAYKMRDAVCDDHSGAALAGKDFRVTFDENILCRDYDISLTSDVYGVPVLEEGKVLMELKCLGGIPLWMTQVLSEEKIYKTSFSKYGTAYSRYIQPEIATEKRRTEQWTLYSQIYSAHRQQELSAWHNSAWRQAQHFCSDWS